MSSGFWYTRQVTKPLEPLKNSRGQEMHQTDWMAHTWESTGCTTSLQLKKIRHLWGQIGEPQKISDSSQSTCPLSNLQNYPTTRNFGRNERHQFYLSPIDSFRVRLQRISSHTVSSSETRKTVKNRCGQKYSFLFQRSHQVFAHIKKNKNVLFVAH